MKHLRTSLHNVQCKEYSFYSWKRCKLVLHGFWMTIVVSSPSWASVIRWSNWSSLAEKLFLGLLEVNEETNNLYHRACSLSDECAVYFFILFPSLNPAYTVHSNALRYCEFPAVACRMKFPSVRLSSAKGWKLKKLYIVRDLDLKKNLDVFRQDYLIYSDQAVAFWWDIRKWN